MAAIAMLLLTLPLAAALICAALPARAARVVSVISGIACFGLAVALVPAAARHDISYLGFVRVDALSAVFLLATAFGYAAVAVYSVGYTAAGHQHPARFTRRFWPGLSLFAWAMLAAPMMSNLAALWVAIEVTTVISALLVAIESTGHAAEAAWKYMLLASAGLAVALLATVFAYYAGSQVLGQSYNLGFTPLLHAAPRLPRTPVQLAFVLAVVGYGTKMGLVPVHTWLPDAHSEAPTPVSALLSGSLLAISFYAILRFYQVARAAAGPAFTQNVLLVFGVASLLLAMLYLFGQKDIKRLLAYSSVEHMGILAIGVSFGAPAALAGVLLHVLAHAAAKSNAFMGAGVLVTKLGTKRAEKIRGGLDLLPASGPLLLIAIFALGAMPPFGLFRSEFEIVAGGLGAHGYAPAAILIIGVTVAFFGLAAAFTPMLLQSRPVQPAAKTGTGTGQLAPAQPAAAAAELAPAQLAAATATPAQPAPAQPGTAQPGTAQPGTAQPGTAQPGTAQQGAAQSGAAQQGAAQSATAQTGPVQPLAAAAQVGTGPAVPARGEPSIWMVVPVIAGVLALLWLGVHPPGELTQLFGRAVSMLSGSTS